MVLVNVDDHRETLLRCIDHNVLFTAKFYSQLTDDVYFKDPNNHQFLSTLCDYEKNEILLASFSNVSHSVIQALVKALINGGQRHLANLIEGKLAGKFVLQYAIRMFSGPFVNVSSK